MTILPSKELLNKVLDKEVLSISIMIDTNNIAQPTYAMVTVKDEIDKFGITIPYNIYNLVHKCKEWVGKQGYQVRETYGFEYSYAEIGRHGMGFDKYMFRFDSNIINPSHVFEYCQWILENKETE